MLWTVGCRLRRKNRNHIDSATKIVQEPGADGTPGSHHMVQLAKTISDVIQLPKLFVELEVLVSNETFRPNRSRSRHSQVQPVTCS